MNYLIKLCDRLGILRSEIDYHVLRASMIMIFLFFGYQKWFEYEAQALVPYISNGPLISWMYPVFGVRGACWFLGVSEWTFGALIFIGFWNKTAGVLGALGGIASFVCTVTIIPFMPGGWAASAGGFPAMTERVAFLMKDFVLIAASFYLLKQDLVRLSLQYRETCPSAAMPTAKETLKRVVYGTAALNLISNQRYVEMEQLAGKVAIVTGASKGIGAAIAKELAAVLGPFFTIQQALKHFPASGGSIINISSIASENPVPNSSLYSATKGAIDTLTMALAKELGPRNIRVNAVAPGHTETEGTIRVGFVGSEKAKELVAETPLGGRFGRPEEVARVVVFLASNDAGWLTGERISASGGVH